MTECESATVDLIIAGPPYNIGTRYGENPDDVPFELYKEIISSVMEECFRVLKREGAMVVEAADSVLMNGRYVQLAGLIQSLCLQKGFYLSERHINFSKSEKGKELPEDDRWGMDYSTIQNAHSNCHQWMVFKKIQSDFAGGGIFYIDYLETEVHPCPFPDQTIELLLSKYYKSGMRVLDPFMGISGLGRKVVLSGGEYQGYEIDPDIYNQATRTLEE